MITHSCPTEDVWMRFLETGSTTRSPDLEHHLGTCGECKRAVGRAREALSTLEALSPSGRGLCPSPEVLATLADTPVRTSGPPPPGSNDEMRLRLHLAACAHCKDDLEDLRALESPGYFEVVAQWMTTRMQVIFQDLAVDGPTVVPMPATRSGQLMTGSVTQVLARDLGDAQLRLELAPGPQGLGHVSVALLPVPVSPVRVDLEKDDVLLESRRLGATGRLSFLGLTAGPYRLTVHRQSRGPLAVDVHLLPPTS